MSKHARMVSKIRDCYVKNKRGISNETEKWWRSKRLPTYFVADWFILLFIIIGFDNRQLECQLNAYYYIIYIVANCIAIVIVIVICVLTRWPFFSIHVSFTTQWEWNPSTIKTFTSASCSWNVEGDWKEMVVELKEMLGLVFCRLTWYCYGERSLSC